MIVTKSGGVWSDQLTYVYTTLPRRHHVSRNKTHPPNIVGNPRSVALILPTFSENVLWVLTSNPRTFLKGFEFKDLKILETVGARSKLCAFIYNCLLLRGKTSSSILFSTPALDGNHLQLSWNRVNYFFFSNLNIGWSYLYKNNS